MSFFKIISNISNKHVVHQNICQNSLIIQGYTISHRILENIFKINNYYWWVVDSLGLARTKFEVRGSDFLGEFARYKGGFLEGKNLKFEKFEVRFWITNLRKLHNFCLPLFRGRCGFTFWEVRRFNVQFVNTNLGFI